MQTSHCSGFSFCRAQALKHVGFGSYSAWALPNSRWGLPRPGIKPVSSALAGGFLTIGPAGKSSLPHLMHTAVLCDGIHLTAEDTNPRRACNQAIQLQALFLSLHQLSGLTLFFKNVFINELTWNSLISDTIFLLFLFWLCCAACRISVPWLGIEIGPQQWEHQILTTRPPGNCPPPCS